jgi:predicted ATPase
VRAQHWPRSLVVISAADGTGKTTLAVHLGHLMRRWYPDGQLYAYLRGMSDAVPAAPMDVLRVLLTALRLRAPENLEAATALLRSVLADRRVPIV